MNKSLQVKARANLNLATTTVSRDTYNVASIVDVSTGITTLTWHEPFASANYTVFGMAGETDVNSPNTFVCEHYDARTASVSKLQVHDVAGNPIDVPLLNVIATGD